MAYSGRMRTWRVQAATALTLALLAALGCRVIGLALGPTPDEARARGGDFFGALARRFGPTDLDPALRAFRARVTAAMFSPAGFFADAAAWPEREPEARQATYAGAPGAAGRYRLDLRAQGAPGRAGEYRGRLRLRRLGEGDFEWTQHDELAVGRVQADDAARALTAALLAVESAPSERAADAVRAALPLTAAALGRALSLERLDLRRDAQGATVLLLGTRLRPDALAAAGSPGFARYLDKYVGRLRFKLSAEDASGLPFWQVDVFDGRALFHWRSLRGDVVSLSGTPRPLPDALVLRTDFTTEAGLFRVGLRALVADLHLTRAPREKAVEAVFRREPEWVLPFVVRPFLRASLRRPFDGEGARVALALREQQGGALLLVRDLRLAVRESWVVRFLGGLGSNAVVAFRRDAEEQSDRFVFEALEALRFDLGLSAQAAVEGSAHTRE